MALSDGAQGEGKPGGRKGPELDRLPPPAFPPGTRRIHAPRTASGVASGPEGFPDGVLISPDEPIRRIGEGFPEGAFISPDDPIDAGGADEEEVQGEVTGIGSYDPEPYRPAGRIGANPQDPEQVASVLEGLARGLRENGSAALAPDAYLSPFESALRGFLGGYLVGGSRRSG
jgi:hypothetical protein